MSKFFYNRATTRICAKKPFIVIECNCDCFGFSKFPINNCVLYSPGWTNLKTTIKAKILPLNVINDLLATFFCSQWMSFGQNLLQLVFRQICETCNLRVFFGFIFVACWIRPERSTPIGKFASSSLVSSIFQGERKLHCNLTGRRLWSQVNKMLTSSYLRTCVRKWRLCS